MKPFSVDSVQIRHKRTSYPDGSPNRTDDEIPGGRVLSLRLLAAVLLLLHRRDEGGGELDVALVKGDFLPLEIGFLVQNPPEMKQSQSCTKYHIQNTRDHLRSVTQPQRLCSD